MIGGAQAHITPAISTLICMYKIGGVPKLFIEHTEVKELWHFPLSQSNWQIAFIQI